MMKQNTLFDLDTLIARADGDYPLTPVQKIGDIFIKRDDLYELAGVAGGKVRSAYYLAQGAKGLVTAGARQSPQIEIVANIAKYMNIPCRVHTIRGGITPELQTAIDAGAELIIHDDIWHNSVIIARAREDAFKSKWTEIPFGMECWGAVRQTLLQVKNIPDEVKRIIVPIGSGMSCAGVLWGLKHFNKRIPVIGVQVGADPLKRLNEYAPKEWRQMLTLIQSDYDYHKPYENNEYHGYLLDPIYEAKCLPYIQPDDLLWVVGIRKNLKDFNNQL